ncbi:MAG: hypothetical protein B6U87_03205 [Candidatus Aenigmarchaeota archaeon ex4484_52]|nr:MAG: hypothetical protein B6U87_03205 [Candidatus Aenigmarchaeota archaeon ex4484_52]
MEENKIKIMIIPVGEQIKPIYEGFRYVEQIDKLFLICTNKTSEFAEEIKEQMSNMYRDINIIQTPAQDFNQICLDLVKNISKEEPNKNHNMTLNFQVIANITGGTKPMSFASYIFASLYDGYSFYIFKKDDNQMQYVEMPKLSLNLEIISYKKTRYKILGLIKEKQYNFTQLAKQLNIKSSTLNSHINKLKKDRLVEIELKGREKIIKASKTGIMLYYLIGVKNGD